MKIDIYPLTFSPVFKDYIWGGRNLETKLGRTLPPGIVAESWEISGHSSSSTKVSNGPLAGKSVPDLLDLLGLDLVGHRSRKMLERNKFPLLVKLLDAHRPLSVQVHPDDEYAHLHEDGELGKTEMWYILYAEPGASLIYGLKEGITYETFQEAVKAGEVESCLHKLPVKAGDTIFIPAGSVHAILEGIVLIEIQQNSDTTYRIYDWNRVGADGKPRPLHLQNALEVIDFNQIEPEAFTPRPLPAEEGIHRELVTTCPYFNVEKITIEAEGKSFKGRDDGETFEIWGTIAGQGQVVWDGEPLDLPAVHFTLLPAMLGDFEIRGSPATVFLRTYVPAPPNK